MLYLLGTSVTYQTFDLETDQLVSNTVAVNSLLTADGIRFLFTSMIRNFMGFGPVGVILVAMIGVGLAEQAGLVTALIKKIVSVAPGLVADLHHRRSSACCRASPPMPATWS